MKKTNAYEVTRRTFLKGSLGVMGAAFLGERLLPTSSKRLMPEALAAITGDTEWIKSYCTSCIWPNCGTEVRVVDGAAVEIRGNKEHPVNKGTLCPRGNALLMNLYNPYRVKAPMKRTNPEKGRNIDPGWVEITWEEALKTVSDRLMELQQTDPRKLLVANGLVTHEEFVAPIFGQIFGTPNMIGSAGALCEVHYAPSIFSGSFVDRIDLGYCNYLIEFGRNIGGSATFASGPARVLADALERGMRLISVDPHAGPESSKGEWIPIKPGTDVAFGMAMLHLILHEFDRYDVDAVKTRTNLPYLIDKDGDYVRDAESSKPVVWDKTAGAAKTFDDPTLGDVALEGSFAVADVEATPAFALLKQSVADKTPEWAEKLTGIPEAKIREITEDFVEESRIGATIVLDGVEYPYRPAALTCGRGSVNQYQGKQFYILANTINAVMGGMGVPGSIVSCPPVGFAVVDGMVTSPILSMMPEFTIPQPSIAMSQFYPNAFLSPIGTQWAAVLDPEKYYLDYQIDTFIYHASNPLLSNTNVELVEEALTNIPFTVGIAYNLDEPSYFADLLLPESSQYERYHARTLGELMAVGKDTINLEGIHAKGPVLDKPVYNTMQYEDIVIELADRLGTLPVLNTMYSIMTGLPPEKALDPTRRYSYKEMVDIRLRAYTGDDNKGLDYFLENGFYVKRMPLTDCYESYLYKQQNARVAVYNDTALRKGNALRANLKKFNVTIPGWVDQTEPLRDYRPLVEWDDSWQTSPPEEFDLYAVNWKISLRNNGLGSQDDNPYLRELVEKWDFDDLSIQMNTAMAKAKGLKTGDRVRVESVHGGQTEGVIKTTELIHSSCLGFPGQAGHWSRGMNPITRKGTSYNQLLSMKEGEITPDGSIVLSVPVKISKI